MRQKKETENILINWICTWQSEQHRKTNNTNILGQRNKFNKRHSLFCLRIWVFYSNNLATFRKNIQIMRKLNWNVQHRYALSFKPPEIILFNFRETLMIICSRAATNYLIYYGFICQLFMYLSMKLIKGHLFCQKHVRQTTEQHGWNACCVDKL